MKNTNKPIQIWGIRPFAAFALKIPDFDSSPGCNMVYLQKVTGSHHFQRDRKEI
jgi:hypothetical protein